MRRGATKVGRLVGWGAIGLLAAGALGAQDFAPVEDVGFRFGVANAGRMRSIAPITGNRIYAGASDGGAWRTDDGGVHWTTPTDLASSLRISALAADPSGTRSRDEARAALADLRRTADR